jgi:hypothetical protein
MDIDANHISLCSIFDYANWGGWSEAMNKLEEPITHLKFYPSFNKKTTCRQVGWRDKVDAGWM